MFANLRTFLLLIVIKKNYKRIYFPGLFIYCNSISCVLEFSYYKSEIIVGKCKKSKASYLVATNSMMLKTRQAKGMHFN